MSAAEIPVVEQVNAKVVRRPRYKCDAFTMSSFRLFYVANEPRLIQYWDELGGYGEAGEADDFVEFAGAQYDLQGNLPAVADFGWL